MQAEGAGFESPVLHHFLDFPIQSTYTLTYIEHTVGEHRSPLLTPGIDPSLSRAQDGQAKRVWITTTVCTRGSRGNLSSSGTGKLCVSPMAMTVGNRWTVLGWNPRVQCYLIPVDLRPILRV